MPEVKTAPYELLIRWNCEKGEKFGEIRGVHRVMQTCLVNDDGTIAMRDGETAKDFPPEEIAAALGEQFATFLAQLEGEQAAHAETKKAHNATLSELRAARESVEAHAQRLGELSTAHGTLKEAFAALVPPKEA